MRYVLRIPAAFGEVAFIYEDEPFGIVEVSLPISGREAWDRAQRTGLTFSSNPPPRVLEVARQVRTYFDGTPLETPWDCLDLDRFTPLQRDVLAATSEIPFGEVRTYGDVARVVGRPRASRFVGTTLAKNPFPILIPCHRVIRADGTVGQFGGGTELKRRMLVLEGALEPDEHRQGKE